MIRDSGARIFIMARAANYAAHHIGRIYDRTRSFSVVSLLHAGEVHI